MHIHRYLKRVKSEESPSNKLQQKIIDDKLLDVQR